MRIKLLLSAVFFILGAGWVGSAPLREKIKEYKIPQYIIENQSYISLRSALKILGCQDSWGKIEDRVFFVYRGREVKFRVGYPEAIIEGKTERMSYPPREVEGEILIHLDSLERLVSQVERLPVPEVKRTEAPRPAEPVGKAVDSSKTCLILVDPGHGGKDNGAVGHYNLKEKDVNLDVAKRMKHYLQTELKACKNVKLVMTREEDIFLSLEERVQLAKDMNADIFFCIHTNSSRYNRLNADGFETYFPRSKEVMNVLPPPANLEGTEEETDSDTVVIQIVQDLNQTTIIDESKILAECIQEKLADRLICPDRGAKAGNFYVLKYTPMTSILTEIGFICNPNIEANLRDVEVRQAIGKTLGDALLDYLKRRSIIPSHE